MKRLFSPALLFLLCVICALPVTAAVTNGGNLESGEKNKPEQLLDTLLSMLAVEKNLDLEIREYATRLKNAASQAEKEKLNATLSELEAQLSAVRRNFEQIAAGIDISSLKENPKKNFSLQEDLLSLLEPLVKELKDVTAPVRERAKLKEEIARYGEILPKVADALENISALPETTKDSKLKARLNRLKDKWQNRHERLQSSLHAAQLQLQKMEREAASEAESAPSYFKLFFEKRGRAVLMAVFTVAIVLLLSRLFYRILVRIVPGYKKRHRPFNIRLLDLFYRIITVLLCIIGPMAVFYFAEDWVLFSLGLLLLLSLAWTVRQTATHFWQQVQLLLNTGAVREGERLVYQGIPWLVQRINFFSVLENPTTGLTLRLPLEELLHQVSRPLNPGEPWFPCKKDDWVLLSDGVRGKVTGLSLEMITLVERGGAHKTYLTGDFLGLSPRNLSVGFRVKEIFGISYGLQEQATSSVLGIMRDYLHEKLITGGYGETLVSLQVEFQHAADSALELVVIADFDGQAAPLYNRVRRAIQRHCVDACTLNEWTIPFPQLTLHQGA